MTYGEHLVLQGLCVCVCAHAAAGAGGGGGRGTPCGRVCSMREFIGVTELFWILGVVVVTRTYKKF